MSGIEDPDTPPELPEEYAAVYRDAYLRALAEEGDGPEPDTGPGAEPGPVAPQIAPEPLLTERPASTGPRRLPVPLLAALAVLVLVLGAFGVGRLVSGGSDPSGPAASGPTTRPGSSTSARPTPARTRTARARPGQGKAWTGPVTPVRLGDVTADCTSKPGVDSAGRKVDYEAANTADDDPTTAWRCDGSAVGARLSITLPAGTEIGEVGLVPGYAKTDPKSGIDRYAENNRITKVRWTLADGVQVVQVCDPDPRQRGLQLLRVPRTSSGTITLEVLAVKRGKRDTTAISQIEVGAAS